MKKFLFIYLFLISSLLISKNLKKELFVKYTENEINIDGILDEHDWSLASAATNFYESFPNHGEISNNQAIIKVMNDDDFLYVGIKVMVKREDLKSNTLRRDFQAQDSDNITMIFDTFNDGSNAYFIQYGDVFSNASLFTLSSDINSGNMRLLITPANTNTTVDTFQIRHS